MIPRNFGFMSFHESINIGILHIPTAKLKTHRDFGNSEFYLNVDFSGDGVEGKCLPVTLYGMPPSHFDNKLSAAED